MSNKEQGWNFYEVVRYVIDSIGDFDINDFIRSRFSYDFVVSIIIQGYGCVQLETIR
jgi:hypothetical protein